MALDNSTTDTLNKPRLRDRTYRAWFSRLLWHPAKKWRGSILTTPEPAWGPNPKWCTEKIGQLNKYQQAVGGRPPRYAPAPLLPLWTPKRCRAHRNIAVVSHAKYVPTLTAAADVLRPRWVKRPGDIDVWPWKCCPSHVWRGLPLCQF